MKIGNLDDKPTVTPVTTERKAARTGETPAGGIPAEPSAQVDLSPEAAALSTDGDMPEFDSEKVARIAQAIRDGKFTVNAEAIADKLIANAQELLSPGSH